MPLIDDDGDLFGVVNVVDALVIVFVLFALTVGFLVVNPFADTGETRYVTLDLGTQPEYVASLISEGDQTVEDAPGNPVTITDVFVTPATGNNAHVVVRAQLTGQPTDEPPGGFEFGGQLLRSGTNLSLPTSEYRVFGDIQALETEQPSLSTRQVPVTISATVPAETGGSVMPNDTVTVAGTDVLSVNNLVSFPGTDSAQRRILVGATVQTLVEDGSPVFSDTPVQVGSLIQFETDRYSLSGTVIRRGDSDVQSQQTSVLLEAGVPEVTSRALSAGDEYRLSDTTIATVDAVTRSPIPDRERHEIQVQLTMTTVERDGTEYFGATPVTVGSRLRFQSGTYSVNWTVGAVGSDARVDSRVNRTIAVEVSNVSPTVADTLSVGMTESIGGRPIARITNTAVEPARIVLTTEGGDIVVRDHPLNKDVTLTVDVAALDTDGASTFHGRPLRTDRSITLDFGTITVDGTVVGVQ